MGARARPRGGTGSPNAGTSRQRNPSSVPSLRFTWVTSIRSNDVAVDAVVVVLAGDLDLARQVVAHRVVAAVMAERQLVGACPRARCRASGGPCRSRRSGTSPEQRRAPWRARGRPRPGRPGRSTGTRRRAPARGCRPPRSTPARPSTSPIVVEVAHDRGLDAEVDGDDAARARRSSDGVRRDRRSVTPTSTRSMPVGAGRRGRRGLAGRRLLGGAERTGLGAVVAEVAGEAPGVDPGDAGDAVAREVRRRGRPRRGGCCARRARSRITTPEHVGAGRLVVGCGSPRSCRCGGR